MATPYMNLSLPTVSSTAGPAWATALNAAFTLVDSHNHSEGQGTQVPSSGININADLSFGGNDATSLRTTRYTDQGSALVSPTDAGCLYIAGGNLYYNNDSATAIQITAAGALNAASIGGIGGDYGTSTASVFYLSSSQKFYFWQDSNEMANIQVGNVVIVEPGVVSPYGITLQSPTSLAADYSLTLPTALPALTLPLTLSAAGVIGTGSTFTGTGSGAGMTLTGGSSGGNGLTATGGATNGNGISGTGGATNGLGVVGQGTGSGQGVKGTGGTTSGAIGVKGIGGSTNGVGMRGEGVGTGTGVQGVGGATGYGVHGTAASNHAIVGESSGSGAGVYGVGAGTGYGVTAEGNSTRAPLHLTPGSQPSSASTGDIYVTAGGVLKIYNGSTWVSVGAQT